MAVTAIKAEGLSKQYRVGELQAARYRSLRESFSSGLRSMVTRDRTGIFSRERIWALRDVSFEVEPGEVLGIIGRNGAGKTTLLRILSRITEPTEGRAEVRGRLGSLLEVGTGFHPELTGRDNIFLNGAILGMRRSEIARKFDEIVEFSGVERFIDTPVKRYSSGMYVRLAFAVAAHLEPDVMLIDEVLAVGDYAFQQKCIGKLREVAGGGRTVLFVSHNMPAVKTLCTRAMLIESGQVTSGGKVDDVVARYLSGGEVIGGEIPDVPRPVGTGEIAFRRVALIDPEGHQTQEVFLGDAIRVRVEFEVKQAVADAAFEVGFSDETGLRVITATSLDRGGDPVGLEPGRYELDVEILDTDLLPHRYSIDLAVHHWRESKVTIDWVERALPFTALDVARTGDDHYVRFSTRYSLGSVRGFVRPESRWGEAQQVA
jgi:lipopolysaccharide transport system ATP-binding protein